MLAANEANLYTPEDYNKSNQLVRDAGKNRRTLLLVRLDLGSQFTERVFLAASLVLFSNLCIMRRCPAGTFKIAEFSHPSSIVSHSVLNCMRGLLAGEFSKISKLQSWIDTIKAATPVPEALISEARASLQFFESYHGANESLLSESADFLIRTRDADQPRNDDAQYLQIVSPCPGFVELSATGGRAAYQWNTFANYELVRMRYAEDLSCIIFDGDMRDDTTFAASWISALNALQSHTHRL